MASSSAAQESKSGEAPPAPAPPGHISRKIVMAVDGSAYSRHALDWALDKLFTKKDKITLLHVFDFQPITTMDLYGSISVANMNVDLEKKGEAQAVKLLKKLAEKCVQRRIKPHLTVLKGPAKHSICDYVAEQNADMLIMSSRGLGAVKRFFLGSVSDYCVHNCQCPVVVIKDDHADDDDGEHSKDE